MSESDFLSPSQKTQQHEWHNMLDDFDDDDDQEESDVSPVLALMQMLGELCVQYSNLNGRTKRAIATLRPC